jgi:hypothetical protein
MPLQCPPAVAVIFLQPNLRARNPHRRDDPITKIDKRRGVWLAKITIRK